MQPDVVLMDVSMPRLSGIEATRRIKRRLPRIRVVGLSMYAEADVAGPLREAGAYCYVAKSSGPEVLIAAIQECCGSDGAGGTFHG